MEFYDKYVLPPLLHLTMRNKEATDQRRRVIPAARGRVLEIGIGSGLNMPFYGPEVTSVHGLDPSEELLEIARQRNPSPPFQVVFENRSAEFLPFEDRGFDSVVTTWTLCSIPDAAAALAEMRRVLRPDGQLLFIEHGLSPDHGVAAWQNRLTPAWRKLAGGCHLNRQMEPMIRAAGFSIDLLETGHLIKGPRPMTYHYRGRARPA